ncbi:hypothetical protein SKAU_G00069890 [Synaphobranchus kaupii]|uniref:VWFD domain-containing protein n=1 Tax=Synaphobranchus kaupii TaxID=118154 RepID=A0A9Q1J9E7_SYNKA|nr:hypothetical protein SKAU_G00069890 [Synaphobranchus kaupii]
MLQEGKTLQLSKPLLVAELRGIYPTSIGLPLEMSLVSTAVATASVTAQVKILPVPTGESSLAQLLNSEIQISTDGTLSMAVSTKATVGINTEVIQVGRELDLMTHTTIPVKFTTTIDVKERNLKLQYDPCLREADLLTVRTDAFSVTRNTEDPTADKKVQLLPESTENYALKSHFKPEALHPEGKDLDLSDETISTKTETPTVEKSLHSSAGQNIICAEALTFGFIVCFETQSQNDANLVGMLLCKVIGFNRLTISLKPVPSSALERVEIEIQTGPKSAAKIIQMSTIAEKPVITQLKGRVLRQLRGKLTTDKKLGDSFPPIFAIVIHARASDGNMQGYELAVYADTMISQPRVQIMAMELGSMEKWKVCVDAELQNDHKALMVMQWGKDCQEYKMTVEEVTGRLATNPALKIKAKWDRIPPTMKYAGKVLGAYLPWTAEILGFTEKWQTNPSKQLSFYLAAPSPSSLDMILKTPEMTIYKRNVPLPFAIPTDGIPKSSDLAIRFSKTITNLAELSSSECIAEGEGFTTFDGVQYMYAMPDGCFHILALDCLFTPRFMILMKLAPTSDHLQVVKAHITDNVIEILPSVSGELKLIYNNHEIPSINLPFIDTHGKVMVKREGQGLVLSAKQYGLDRIYFSGERTELRIGAIMRGRMCGMCGHNDGETNLVFHMPDGKMANSAGSFAHSWMLMHDSCREGCKLQHDRVDLGRTLSIFGEPSHCYSAEPVLRCAPGCSPIRTARLNISVHCHTTDSPLNMDDYASPVWKKAAMMDSVLSHTECSCPTDQCSG